MSWKKYKGSLRYRPNKQELIILVIIISLSVLVMISFWFVSNKVL